MGCLLTLFLLLSLYLKRSRRNRTTSGGQMLWTLRSVAMATGIACKNKTFFYLNVVDIA